MTSTKDQRFLRATIEAYEQGEMVSAVFVEQHGIDALVEMSEYRLRCEVRRRERLKSTLFLLVSIVVALGLIAFLLMPTAKAEEPTKTGDAFYQVGKGIGWLGHRIEDAGKGLYRSATEDDEACADILEEMSRQCLEEFIGALSKEIQLANETLTQAKLRLASPMDDGE